MPHTLPKAVLLLTTTTALYTLWLIPYQTGLLPALLDLQKPGAILPGSVSEPMHRRYTGVGVIDGQVVTMVGFFWPALDGRRVDVSLAFVEIVAQAMGAWVLVVVESLRVGNRGVWYVTSYVYLFLLYRCQSVNEYYGLTSCVCV
jgi:hypothetical protein